MSNRIETEQGRAIAGLKAQGWSDRKIGKELGLNRRTVKRYPASKCTIAQIGKRGRKSQCAGHQLEITQWYESGLSIERIHSDLVRECGYKGSYHSVYRFAQSVDISESKRVYRIECEAGQEAQIDYGTLPPPGRGWAVKENTYPDGYTEPFTQELRGGCFNPAF